MCFFLFQSYARGLADCSTGRLLFLLLWTLAPRDYVTYCHARGLSGHITVSVFALICKTPHLLKLKKIISLSRGQTLSGHNLSTVRKFSILNLSSLHPSGKPHLGKLMLGQTVKLVGYGPQLLGDSLRWSDHESDCSALFTPARTSSRWHCTMDTRRSGTSCGGYDPGYP